MLAQPIMETDRLILRPPTHSDASSIQVAVSAREIADTMISIPHPYPDGEAARYIARQLAESDAGHSRTFVIECKFQRRLLGVIEIRDIEREHSQAELSFWLAVGAWGQGYMSEALKPILRVGFEDLELNRLYAYHLERNPGSGKVLQKNGFLREGVLRQRVRKWGVFENAVLWAILRQDWEMNFRAV
jgi:RimJ/RimL family protein N-acetyltransferase